MSKTALFNCEDNFVLGPTKKSILKNKQATTITFCPHKNTVPTEPIFHASAIGYWLSYNERVETTEHKT